MQDYNLPAIPNNQQNGQMRQSDPWEQFPNESSLWYERFHLFLLLGPSRSIPQLMREIGASPTSAASFYSMSKKFQWKERCLEWDKLQSNRERTELANLRIENKKRRVEVLSSLMEKLNNAIEFDLDGDVLDWKSVGIVAKNVMSELRAEFEGDTENHTQNQDFTFTLNIAKPAELLRDDDPVIDDDEDNIIEIS